MTITELKERRGEVENLSDACSMATTNYLKDVLLDAVEMKMRDFQDPFFKNEVKEMKKAVKEARKTRNMHIVCKAFEGFQYRLNKLI